MRHTKARYAGRERRLDTTKRVFHSGTVLWFEISAALLQPVKRKLKRLRVRLASLDIFCRDDRREALQESSCTQNVPNLASPRPGGDPDWTAARGGTYRVCGALKQDVFPLYRAEVIDALALDQLVEFCFPQLECVLLPQLLKTVAIVQRQIALHVFSVCKCQAFLFHNPAKSMHVNGVVIGEDAVEIKDNGSNHEETLG